MLVRYLLVFAAFLLDGALASMFPVMFGIEAIYFVPCIGFSALVLTIRHFDTLDSFIISILFGMFYDFFYANTAFLYTFLFALMCFIVRLWIKQINESFIENISLCVSTIFVRELVVYIFMYTSNQSTMGFDTWLGNRIFLTLIVNGIFIFLLVFISFIVDDYLDRRDLQLRKEERLPWMRSK